MIRLAETEKQEAIKGRSYEAVRALIKDGWELIELIPSKGRSVVWYAQMVKGEQAVYLEVSSRAYGLVDAQYLCPRCGDETDDSYCEKCDDDIEGVLIKTIPADFKGGECGVAETFNR